MGGDDHMKALNRLLRLPENTTCAECLAPAPLWASVNLGVFICVRCSGIHRGLGTHVSFVRSVTLDSWTPAQVNMMIDVGNDKARAVWEAHLPANFQRPVDGRVEQFIKDKYIKRAYADFKPPSSKPSKSSRDPKPSPEHPEPTTNGSTSTKTSSSKSSSREDKERRDEEPSSKSSSRRRSERSERSDRSERSENSSSCDRDRKESRSGGEKSSRRSKADDDNKSREKESADLKVASKSNSNDDWHNDMMQQLMGVGLGGGAPPTRTPPTTSTMMNDHSVMSLFESSISTQLPAGPAAHKPAAPGGGLDHLMDLFDQPDHVFQPSR